MSNSTFDRLMEDESFKKDFDSGYSEFLLEESLVLSIEEHTGGLSKDVGLSNPH